MSDFDVLVLGAGPGGYVAAIRAAQLGKSVAVVEEKYWGGVCLNVGCIPSKALLRNAELAHIFTQEAKTFGIQVNGEVSFDYGAAFTRSRKVADGRVKGVHYLMKKNKITQYDGRGTFRDDRTLDVTLSDGGTETVTFGHCIIAAGATTTLRLGTGVTNTSTRHPAATAAGIASVHVASGGRASLGIGRGDSALAHVGFAPAPVEELEAYVGVVRAYLRGESVSFDDLARFTRPGTRVLRALGLADAPVVPVPDRVPRLDGQRAVVLAGGADAELERPPELREALVARGDVDRRRLDLLETRVLP